MNIETMMKFAKKHLIISELILIILGCLNFKFCLTKTAFFHVYPNVSTAMYFALFMLSMAIILGGRLVSSISFFIALILSVKVIYYEGIATALFYILPFFTLDLILFVILFMPTYTNKSDIFKSKDDEEESNYTI